MCEVCVRIPYELFLVDFFFYINSIPLRISTSSTEIQHCKNHCTGDVSIYIKVSKYNEKFKLLTIFQTMPSGPILGPKEGFKIQMYRKKCLKTLHLNNFVTTFYDITVHVQASCDVVQILSCPNLDPWINYEAYNYPKEGFKKFSSQDLQFFILFYHPEILYDQNFYLS